MFGDGKFHIEKPAVTNILKGKARRAKIAEIKQNMDRPPKFYYLRDKTGLPLVTVCDIIYKNTIYRGISIFSPRVLPTGQLSITPNPINKKKIVLKKSSGRSIALDRALAAAISGIPQLPIQRKEALETLKMITQVPNQPIDLNTILSHKTGILGTPIPKNQQISPS